ncbi:MAG: P-loop NTPase, partial [Pirellulales bacterium]|nr:P-loop NTPase [Pirellulales bacterium]
VCPKCGEQIDLFKRGGGKALAQEMDVPFLGQIPIDPEVVMAGDAGRAFLHDGPESPTTEAFAEVVRTVLCNNLQKQERPPAEQEPQEP